MSFNCQILCTLNSVAEFPLGPSSLTREVYLGGKMKRFEKSECLLIVMFYSVFHNMDLYEDNNT